MQPFLRLDFVTPVRDQERSRWFFVEKPDFEAVPGTEIQFGGQQRFATVVEPYVAERVKDLPAFAKVMDVADSALDGRIL